MAAMPARPWTMVTDLTVVIMFLSGFMLMLADSAADDISALLPPNSHIFAASPSARRDVLVVCRDDKKRQTCTATCPRRCRNKCVGICPSCKTYCLCDLLPKSICGDPRFIGADGNTFYFHGKKDQDFCILSDNDLHINAHFIGKHNPENNRDFTWVQALGIIFGDNHKLYIGVQKTTTWDDSIDRLVITFNGEHIHIPTEVQAKWVSTTVPTLSLTRTSVTNGIMAELKGVFTIMTSAVPISKEESESHNYGVTPDNSLAHLDLSFKFYSLTDDVHGVLGQTHRSDYVNKLDVRKKMPLMTGEAKYSSSSIFATDCAVSRLHDKPEIAMVTEMFDN